ITIGFLLIITNSCKKDKVESNTQSYNTFKAATLNLCVLIVDYKTYKFEGGDLNYYTVNTSKDSLPFIIDYVPPGDFGSITFKLNKTFDTVFRASIIWAGTGNISFPKKFSLSNPFNLLNKKVIKPNIEYFGMEGKKVYDDTLFIHQADSAWSSINSLEITNKFSEVDFKVGIYLYPPSEGAFIPDKAKWIIFLYYNGI
ncbi:MAG: hypothetical protein WCJ61_14535, partial [Paludibacter sp.]